MEKPVALGADHGGFALKEAVRAHLDERGVPYVDYGTHSEASVDYPDMGRASLRGRCARRMRLCIAVLRHGRGHQHGGQQAGRNPRLLLQRRFQRQIHTPAQRRQRPLSGRARCRPGLACELVDLFLDTPFEGGRHAGRVAKISALEQR